MVAQLELFDVLIGRQKWGGRSTILQWHKVSFAHELLHCWRQNNNLHGVGDCIRVWQIDNPADGQGKQMPSQTLKTASSADGDTSPGAEVWRVQWNITGTVLASSGEYSG